MRKQFFPYLLLILMLVSCQVDETESLKVISKATIPPDASPGDLYDAAEIERQSKEIMAANPGGTSIWIRGTYEEMVPSSYDTYHIKHENPFVGEYILRSGKLESHNYIFLCLLDYVQTPCHPGAASFQFVEGITRGDVVRIPLQFFMNETGMHDVVVVHQADPYLPGPVGHDFQERTLRDVGEFRINVFVDDVTTTPPIQYMEPPLNRPGNRTIPYAFKETIPNGSQGSPDKGWPLWTETIVAEGELFDVDLNFDGDQDRRYAIVAFIDFHQVPIYVEGDPHLPLFVQAKEAVWESLPIQLRAPESLGSHELRLIALGEPFTPLDLLLSLVGKHPNALASPRSSPRVLLKVE